MLDTSNNVSNLKLNNFNQKFVFVVADYYKDITTNMYKMAVDTLLEAGAKETDIKTVYVPGAFELPYAAHKIILTQPADCVICLGCVIKGETPHFDFICQAIAHKIIDVSLKHNKPVIFGVLTTNTKQQAVARSGDKSSNKGVEAAKAAIQMVNF